MYDVKQVFARGYSDCGATCMRMLLMYYGINADGKALYKQCNTNPPTGCTFADMLRCGRKYGLDMKAYRMDADELIRQDRPSIVWWNHNHAVVCCGMDGDRVVICDPSGGRYRLTPYLLERFYSGICIFNGIPEDLPDDAEETDPE